MNTAGFGIDWGHNIWGGCSLIFLLEKDSIEVYSCHLLVEVDFEGKRIAGCVGSSKAMILAREFMRAPRPVVVIVPDLKSALNFRQDLRFFIPSQYLVGLFSPIDVHPYRHLSPNPDIIMERLGLLWKFSHSKTPFVVVVPLSAALRRLIPRSFFEEQSVTLTKGDSIHLSDWILKLARLGYQRVPLVEDFGTFAVRGGILDIFSAAHEGPCRIEFFGDVIESMRFFDAANQKSVLMTDQIFIPPAREILLEALPANWKGKLKKLADHHEIPKTERDRIREFLENKVTFSGIETYLPFFYDNLSSLFDYLPGDTLLVFEDENDLHLHQRKFLEEMATHREKSGSLERVFDPKEIFLTKEELTEYTGYFQKLDFIPFLPPPFKPKDLGGGGGEGEASRVEMESNETLTSKISVGRDKEKALVPLAALITERRRAGNEIHLVASSVAQKERLEDLIGRLGQGLLTVEKGPISGGFFWPEEKQWWITDEEIFGQKARRAQTKPAGEVFSSFSELTPGDYVVHEQHGVGIYRGLLSLTFDGIKNDFLLLEYLGGDKLYVPADQINRISRYSAQEGSHPLLDKMGGATWKKVREKVKRATRRLAQELLNFQAMRATAKGFAFSPRSPLFEEFEATFPFDETDDQLRAIEEVLRDMERDRPMDRLVCGDVGYGKTEVAIRAAYKAALDSKQTAILVPTTVLAFQHYENFKKRFQDFPVKVDFMSRFQTSAEQKKVAERLTTGETDIVIGTHRLLSSDIRFRDLGLLVIDEEQHFGVAQKEKIKKLRELVDVLTLSATPIPRTLNFALVGIRDLSVINTPPVDRLSIRTYVTHLDPTTVREAILREIQRGGQVFFVHNRIQTIGGVKEKLEKIVPEATIRVAHGQLPEDELEQIMLDFMEQKFSILLSTAIIESGLDIPSANTIFINRAEHMGLSQLYQLRGRVGRSHHRAYCYLLIPHDSILSEVAKKRIGVIQKFTDLGSGFKIASHDLEIRGAGNILGSEQSGHITAIGYDLYVKLLEEAVRELKGETFEEVDPELKLPVSAVIPETLVPDTQMRLVLYKQLSGMVNEEECRMLREEWIDRFGKLPPETEVLIRLIEIKIKARRLKISQIATLKDGFVYQIHPASSIPLGYFLTKANKEPKRYRILPDGKFFIRAEMRSEEEVLRVVMGHLDEMGMTAVGIMY